MTATSKITTDPARLSPAERAALLSDWSAKNRARHAEQQRLQQSIYLRTLGSDNTNAFERALALHNGAAADSIDDAEKLAIVTKDVHFWDSAIGELSHLVARDRDNASVAASRAVRPEYMKRLQALADCCENVWTAFLAVDAVGADLRAAGHTPSSCILPNAPLSVLAAFNSNNPASQLSAFKKMLAE